MERIPVAGPWITQREIDYVTDAVTNCWYGQASRYHDRFERAFADYIGVQHAVALPSCTSAIHLSLAALGIGPGDEVIVPDVTWIASAAPIIYVGATPIFADIDEHTWCLSPASVAQCITDKTKAIVAVDLYGNMPDMDALLNLATRHGIAVIEDAAEAFGSENAGRKAGSFGDTGVFSFHGSKTITTGEGGMLVTDRRDLFDRVCFLRDHGRAPGDVSFYNWEVAFKYRMSSLQAALGLAQLERAEELVARKREIFRWYAERLQGIPGLTLNSEPVETVNSYWMVTAVLDPGLGWKCDVLMQRLSKRGIDTRPFFRPLSSLPAFHDAADRVKAQRRNVVAYRLSPCGINLPSAMSLTAAQVDIVCETLAQIVSEEAPAYVADAAAA